MSNTLENSKIIIGLKYEQNMRDMNIYNNGYEFSFIDRVLIVANIILECFTGFFIILIFNKIHQLSLSFAELSAKLNNTTNFFIPFLFLYIGFVICFIILIYWIFYHTKLLLLINSDNCKSVAFDKECNQLIMHLSKNERVCLPVNDISKVRVCCGRIPCLHKGGGGVLSDIVHIKIIDNSNKIYRVTLSCDDIPMKYYGIQEDNKIEKFLYNKAMSIVELLGIPNSKIEQIQISIIYKLCWHRI